MKGLILDNFYKTLGGMKMFGVLVLAAGIVMMITGNQTILELFVYISITAISAGAVSSMRKDAEAKWDKYEITLPVKKNDIVKSKYFSYAGWLITGFVTAVILVSAAVLIHGNVYFAYGLRDVISLFTLSIVIALMVGAIFFPLAYLIGIDKSEVLLISSIICGVGSAFLMVGLVNRWEIRDAFDFYLRAGILLMTSVLLFLLSYFITQTIFTKKEF